MREVYWDADDILKRLRRVEGQVRAVEAMVQRRESCHDILIQVAAVEGAMRQIARIVTACSVAEALTQATDGALAPDAVRRLVARALTAR